MRIHFCDLCNESVPQSDLDEGRAFLRKGRVVCARCDRSMSHGPEAAGPFSKEAEAGLGATPAMAVAEGRADGGLRGLAPAASTGTSAADARVRGHGPLPARGRPARPRWLGRGPGDRGAALDRRSGLLDRG